MAHKTAKSQLITDGHLIMQLRSQGQTKSQVAKRLGLSITSCDRRQDEYKVFLADQALERNLSLLEMENMIRRDGLETYLGMKTAPKPIGSLPNELPDSTELAPLTGRLMAESSGVGLDYQIKKARELCSAWLLPVVLLTPGGAIKYEYLPIQNSNIDWEKEVVYFGGEEYPVNQLVEDRKTRAAGLKLLQELSATSAGLMVTTAVRLRALELQERIHSAKAVDSGGDDTSAPRIMFSRPPVKTYDDE